MFGDLATVAQCQLWITPTPPDTVNALLAQLITGASDLIEHYLDRFLPLADYEESRDGQGGHTMLFANYPVVSVASVTIEDRLIPIAQTMRGFGYAYNRTALTLRGCRFWRGIQNVVIDYRAGHEVIPAAATQACVELVGLEYRERSRIGIASENVAELQSYTYRIVDLLPRTLLALDLLKNVTPISADRGRRAPTQTDPAILVAGI